MSTFFRMVALVVAAVVLVLLGGVATLLICGPGGQASAMIGGRQVVATSARPLNSVSLSSDGRTGTAQVGGQTVRVSAEEIEVVGVRKVSVPAACKNIELLESPQGIRIFLDGMSTD